LKERSVLLGINYLKNALQSCCGNVSGNHKLKIVVIGKAKKPLSLNCNCIPLHYHNQKGAWLDGEIFENWF
jgi:hypothetical protein